MKMHFPVAPFTQLRSEDKELLPSPECSDWVQPQPKGSAERRAVTPRQLCRAALLVELVAMAFHLQRWNLLEAHLRLISLFNQQKFRIPSLKVFFFFRHPKMKFLNHTNTRNPQKTQLCYIKNCSSKQTVTHGGNFHEQRLSLSASCVCAASPAHGQLTAELSLQRPPPPQLCAGSAPHTSHLLSAYTLVSFAQFPCAPALHFSNHFGPHKSVTFLSSNCLWRIGKSHTNTSFPGKLILGENTWRGE